MRISIVGAGNIGKTLIRRLSKAGHEVRFANSRGPETLSDLAAETGATAVTVAEALMGEVDVVILSIPFGKILALKPLVAKLPSDTVVIDTSNYTPTRDEPIEAIDNGGVESVWIEERLGRPIARAWNTVLTDTFEHQGSPKGAPSRLAIPVTSSDEKTKEIAMMLVEDTGFDAVDAGSSEDSWRVQHGNPLHCTALTAEQMTQAIAHADRNFPARRNALLKIMGSWIDADANFDSEDVIRLHRAATRRATK